MCSRQHWHAELGSSADLASRQATGPVVTYPVVYTVRRAKCGDRRTLVEKVMVGKVMVGKVMVGKVMVG